MILNIRSGDDLRGKIPGDYLVSMWPDVAELPDLDRYERILLWFEHCWFCQASLVSVLPALGLDDRLWLVSTDEFMGSLDAAALGSLVPERVTAAQVALAARALDGLAAPSPVPLQTLVDEADPALPYLAAAVRRHLSDLPWSTDGLGLTERLTLDAVARGARTLEEVFPEVRRADPAPWMGDAMLLPVLSHLAAGPRPVLLARDGGWVPTDEAGAVLAGERRWHGAPRWLGGVQIDAVPQWWWDPQASRVSRTGSPRSGSPR